jgi:hypothetical protein
LKHRKFFRFSSRIRMPHFLSDAALSDILECADFHDNR